MDKKKVEEVMDFLDDMVVVEEADRLVVMTKAEFVAYRVIHPFCRRVKIDRRAVLDAASIDRITK